MRILFFGAGSLGSAMGCLLAEVGHEITLVGRAAHVDAINASGLHLSGIWGRHYARNLVAQTNVGGLTRGAFDFILVTVKSFDTREAALAIAPLVDEHTLVCSYQNGLGNVEEIARVVGWSQTFGARGIFGAWMPEPGAVEVTAIAAPSELGTYDASTPTELVRQLASVMDAAGVPTVYSENIASVLWAKVAYNCALNPLSALLNLPYGGVAEGETRETVCEVIRELYAVGLAEGIALKPASADDYIEFFFTQLLPPTAQHFASMHQDVLRKKRTEIDSLNGAIVALGLRHGIPTPVNATLTRLIKAKEAGYLTTG